MNVNAFITINNSYYYLFGYIEKEEFGKNIRISKFFLKIGHKSLLHTFIFIKISKGD